MRAAGIDPDKRWTPPMPPPAGGDKVKECGMEVEMEEEEEWKEKGVKGGQVDGGVELDEEQRPTGLFRENSIRIVESAISKPSFETRWVESVVAKRVWR